MKKLLLLLFITLLLPPLWTHAATVTTTYTFTSNAWKATDDKGKEANWTSKKNGGQFTSGRGVQVTENTTKACANSPIEFTNVTKVEVSYCTNKSAGAGNINISQISAKDAAYVQNPTKSQAVTSTGGTTLRTMTFDFAGAELNGYLQLSVTCSTNSIYINSISVTEDKADQSGLLDAGLAWNPESITLTKGETLIAPTFTKATDAAVTFSSSNTSVATVDSNGLISLGTATGTATITATSLANATYKAGSATCTITVNPEGGANYTEWIPSGTEATGGKIDQYTTWSATEGTNPPTFYTGQLRIYKNGGTFKLTTTRTIEKIVITFDTATQSTSYGFTTSTANPLTTTPSPADQKEFTWSASQTTRITKVEIFMCLK